MRQAFVVDADEAAHVVVGVDQVARRVRVVDGRQLEQVAQVDAAGSTGSRCIASSSFRAPAALQ